MISFKKFYNESIKSTDKEYNEYLDNFYKNSKLLDKNQVEYLKSLAKSSEIIFNPKNIKIEKSDNSNLIVRWLEQDNYIILLGIISKAGRLVKSDIKDLNIWINKLSSKLIDEHKILLTSPNEISSLMLKHLKDNIIKAGKQYKQVDLGNDVQLGDSPYLRWKTYQITAE